MKRVISIVTACVCMLTITNAHGQQAVDFRDALRMAFPATVSVSVPGQQDGFQQNPQARIRVRQFDRLQEGMFGGFGAAPQRSTAPAGFAISADQIITQLSSDVDEVVVKTYDKTEHDGTVVARDNVTGLCVVKVDGVELVSLVSGDGSPEPGLPIVTTWLANGVGVSKGGMIACEPNSAQASLGFTQQIDTGDQMQHAGSPIVDSDGVLVGITVFAENGSVVCMPAAQLNRLIDLALADDAKDLERGVVGIQFARNTGPLVSGVNSGSPADQAGLTDGDKIKQINDHKVDSAQDVIAAVSMARAGDSIEVTIEREGDTIERTIKLGEYSAPRAILQPLGQGNNLGQQGNQKRNGGMFRQQAWKLENGKLVPMDPGNGGEMQIQAMIEEMQKGFPGFDGMPEMFVPKGFGGLQIERSDTEEELREMKEQLRKQKEENNELQEKLREAQQ